MYIIFWGNEICKIFIQHALGKLYDVLHFIPLSEKDHNTYYNVRHLQIPPSLSKCDIDKLTKGAQSEVHLSI